MKNLMGTPPPPPPPDVPALDNTVAADLPMRQRLAEHRANPACASCHATMDPIGFALENFDAVGRWRETDAGQVIDASAELPGGVVFDGVTGLQRYLLDRPEVFVRTLTEKLMIFSLGRGLGHSDGPVVRQIVRDASQHEYSFAELAVGIVLSEPFRNKRVN